MPAAQNPLLRDRDAPMYRRVGRSSPDGSGGEPTSSKSRMRAHGHATLVRGDSTGCSWAPGPTGVRARCTKIGPTSVPGTASSLAPCFIRRGLRDAQWGNRCENRAIEFPYTTRWRATPTRRWWARPRYALARLLHGRDNQERNHQGPVDEVLAKGGALMTLAEKTSSSKYARRVVELCWTSPSRGASGDFSTTGNHTRFRPLKFSYTLGTACRPPRCGGILSSVSTSSLTLPRIELHRTAREMASITRRCGRRPRRETAGY